MQKFSKAVIEAAKVVLECAGATVASGRAGAHYAIVDELAAQAAELPKGPTARDLMGLWNELRDSRLPECKALTPGRLRAAAARLKEFPERETWTGFMRDINASDFLLGKNPSASHPGWRANFDWFIKPGSVVRYLEGGYKQAGAPRAESARDKYADELDRR